MGQRRAMTGGEIGANGEYYKGGAFIATTDRPKGNTRRTSGTGIQEIEPYIWQVPSQDNLRSIYRRVAGMVLDAKYFHESGKMRLIQGDDDRLATIIWHYFNEDIATGLREAQELMDRFNAGERWYECQQ